MTAAAVVRMLTLRLPKPELLKARKIPIQAADQGRDTGGAAST